MLSAREAALLDAAATIYAGRLGATPEDAVVAAAALLGLIQAREPKATTKCYGCGCSGPSNCVCPKER